MCRALCGNANAPSLQAFVHDEREGKKKIISSHLADASKADFVLICPRAGITEKLLHG